MGLLRLGGGLSPAPSEMLELEASPILYSRGLVNMNGSSNIQENNAVCEDLLRSQSEPSSMYTILLPAI